jgi:hypothetical protein
MNRFHLEALFRTQHDRRIDPRCTHPPPTMPPATPQSAALIAGMPTSPDHFRECLVNKRTVWIHIRCTRVITIDKGNTHRSNPAGRDIQKIRSNVGWRRAVDGDKIMFVVSGKHAPSPR